MNIKCFSDLEAWLQGVVRQVKMAAKTTEVVCLQLNTWSHGVLENDLEGSSVWIAEHTKHYYFNNHQELRDIIERLKNPPLLYRKF